MKRKLLFIGLLTGMVITFLSCAGEHPGFKKTKSGIFYKLHVDNKGGEPATIGDILEMDMIYQTVDSILFDTKANNQPMRLPLLEKQFDGDIYEALAILKVGDSATFILDAESFFLKTAGMMQLPEFITPGEKIYFHVKLNSARSETELADERNALMDQREALEPVELAAYLEENNITVQPTASGLYYIEKVAGTGPVVKDGDKIKAHFVIKTINSPQLYSSYEVGNPLDVEIGRMFDNEGITEALKNVRMGTRAIVIVPSALAFGREGRGDMVPPHSTMVYEIEIVEVVTKEEFQKQQQQKEREEKMKEDQARAQEKINILNYMKDKNLEGKPTATGLYYIETFKGDGPKAEMGKKVRVHYTGTLLNGSKFDSSVDRGQPFEFTLGMGQVIKGWDEGIAKMNVGSKGLLIVPFELGYGNRAMGDQIPAYSTLVFEVELIGVE